jgi:D-alanyl-D-alanine carboxypeptidase
MWGGGRSVTLSHMTAIPRRTVLTLAAAGAATLVAGAPARASTRSEEWFTPLQTAIEDLPDGPPPTTTAAQVRITGSAGTWEGRSGVSDVHSGRPVPAGARFRIGSVTKVFTATVVLQLAAEGRLRLDAPVAHYLPGLLPAEYATATVRHLLDHRTGLPSPATPNDVAWQIAHRYDRHTAEQLIREALRNKQEFTPGDYQRYTNMGYIVAGVLIRRLTGRPYGVEITRRILRPLGLRDTVVPGNDPEIRGPHAHGYQLLDDKLVDVTSWNQSVTPAAGDLISSLRDLDTFTRALLGGHLLPPAQQQELFAVPAKTEYGTGKPATFSAGLNRLVELPDGRTVWGKSGARYGYNAAIAATPDAASRLVYSVNSTDAKSEEDNPVLGRIIGAATGILLA